MEKKKPDLVEEARQLRLQTEALERQAEDLEKKVLAARGTERIRRPTAPGHPAVKPSRGPHYVGDEGTTDDLTETVRVLLTERPMYFRDILEATGARDNRVKGVITRLQREGHRVVDIAPEGSTRALWFIPSDEVLTRLTRVKRATERR